MVTKGKSKSGEEKRFLKKHCKSAELALVIVFSSECPFDSRFWLDSVLNLTAWFSYHVVTFWLHTCWTWLAWRTVIWQLTNHKMGLLFVLYLLPGARGCQRLHPLASRIVRDNLTPLISCVSHVRLPILTGLCSKSNRVVLISRGHILVTHLLDLTALTRYHTPVDESQRNSLSKHTGLLGTNRKSVSYVI